jgi:hypothetical protein
MMENSTVKHHKKHKSPVWRGLCRTSADNARPKAVNQAMPAAAAQVKQNGTPGPAGPVVGSTVSASAARCPGGAAHARAARLAELVFAPVRPGFVAACMVEPTVNRVGLRLSAGLSARPGLRLPAGGPGASGRNGAAGTPAARRGRRAAAPRRAPECLARTCGAAVGRMEAGFGETVFIATSPAETDISEHLGQVAASLRGGVRPGSAVGPRQRAVARGPILTTLGDWMVVQSNIFKIVVT